MFQKYLFLDQQFEKWVGSRYIGKKFMRFFFFKDFRKTHFYSKNILRKQLVFNPNNI